MLARSLAYHNTSSGYRTVVQALGRMPHCNFVFNGTLATDSVDHFRCLHQWESATLLIDILIGPSIIYLLLPTSVERTLNTPKLRISLVSDIQTSGVLKYLIYCGLHGGISINLPPLCQFQLPCITCFCRAK